jgi:hypothetical protein
MQILVYVRDQREGQRIVWIGRLELIFTASYAFVRRMSLRTRAAAITSRDAFPLRYPVALRNPCTRRHMEQENKIHKCRQTRPLSANATLPKKSSSEIPQTRNKNFRCVSSSSLCAVPLQSVTIHLQLRSRVCTLYSSPPPPSPKMSNYVVASSL